HASARLVTEALAPLQGSELIAAASAPKVPPPLARPYATKVVLDVEIKEHTRTLSDGVSYTYWTFGDDTPGKFLRVREGDLIETQEGLPKVDREYFVVQGEFYTTGKFGEAGHQQFSMAKALEERPEYVVFNGHVGSLMGAGALTAQVGERVRIYLGNAGPSLVS